MHKMNVWVTGNRTRSKSCGFNARNVPSKPIAAQNQGEHHA